MVARRPFDSKHEGFGAIYVMDADGARPRRLTPASSSSMMASWSNDGKWVYYSSDRSGDWQVWKQPMPEGKPVQVTLHGGREAKESRDGRLLYYTNDAPAGHGQLWQVPVEGGAETPVDGLQGSNVGRQWALADTGIYFVLRTSAPAEYGVVCFDFATRRTRRLFARANKPVPGTSGPSVSPDGRWLLYSQVDR
jgi:Tol biopolymer transport system component